LRINRAAIDAQLEWTGKGHLVGKKRHTKDDLEVFERSFNAACASIARGEFRHAEVLLNRAKRMYSHIAATLTHLELCSASEDLDDELRKSELLPIAVQQAYVLARMSRDDDVAKFYEAVRLEECVSSIRWTC
jgi:signal recognition particle subunit SRP72